MVRWQAIQILIKSLIVLELFVQLNSVICRPAKSDEGDQGFSLFDETNKVSGSDSPVSVPFVIPSSYNKLRVPKFRNRKPTNAEVVPMITRNNNDGNKRKYSTTTFSPPASGFAPPIDYNLFNSPVNGPNITEEKTFLSPRNEENLETDQYEEASKSNLVEVRIIIQNIREIDEVDEELTVDMDIILSWVDWAIYQANKNNAGDRDDGVVEHKLVTTESLDPNTLQKIWKPDIFIENAVSIKKPKLISEPVKLLYSAKDGRFIYITRATVKTSCQMEFQYYPSDTQNCNVKIRSYAHSTEEITLNWDSTLGGVFIMDRDDNNFDVRISSIVEARSIDADDVAHLNFTNQYHLLEYTVSARRRLSYHLIQTYLPSLFFVLITWLCFLIPSELFEARIGVTMTTLLTLTSMFSSVRENTPIVSYVRAIDIWMVACIYFVFLTLLEFTLLICLRQRRAKQGKLDSQKRNRKSRQLPETSESSRDPGSIINSSMKANNFKSKENFTQPIQNIRVPIVQSVNVRRKSPVLMRIQSFLGRRRRLRQAKDKMSDLIEKYSFITYSVLFVLFNVFYWPWLFVASQHFVWNVDSKYNGPLE